MKHSTVLNAVQWCLILGLIPMLLSAYTLGSLSDLLMTLSTIILSAVAGAIATHLPGPLGEE